MRDGKRSVINDGSVKSLTVQKINNVPNTIVEFAKDKLQSKDGFSYIAKVINDDQQIGNTIFYCDNGKCSYANASDQGDNTILVKSNDNAISVGETIVIERTSPNPAYVAEVVVTADMLK